ncbi:MAG: GGDEF domain-containing protein [Pseudoxanthomonas sp.]
MGVRIMTVAFVGVHVPLLVLTSWLLLLSRQHWHALMVPLLIVLLATLAGTGMTLWMIHRLLTPLREAVLELERYCERPLPLPPGGHDEIDQLLRRLRHSLLSMRAGLKKLTEEATLDALTGALNRRGAQQAMLDSAERASAQSLPFCVAVLDLDDLKPINDQYGHAAGDAVLQALVARTRLRLGDDDWVGRWGGDEFVVGLHLPIEAAVALLDALLHELRSATTPVRLSAGVAQWQAGEEVDALYRRADELMYRVKFSGGGRLLHAV